MGEPWEEIERKKRKAVMKQHFLDMLEAHQEAVVEFEIKMHNMRTKEMVLICGRCDRLCFGQIEFEVHTCKTEAPQK